MTRRKLKRVKSVVSVGGLRAQETDEQMHAVVIGRVYVMYQLHQCVLSSPSRKEPIIINDKKMCEAG